MAVDGPFLTYRHRGSMGDLVCRAIETTYSTFHAREGSPLFQDLHQRKHFQFWVIQPEMQIPMYLLPGFKNPYPYQIKSVLLFQRSQSPAVFLPSCRDLSY